MTKATSTPLQAATSNISSLVGKSVMVAGLVLAGATAAQAAGDNVCADDLEIEYQNDPEAIDYGRERFSARCVYCHGGGGRGAKGPALVKGKFKHGGCNQDIVGNIASGIPNTQMGAFGRSLEFDEILKIVAYLRDEERKLREAGEIE